MIPIIIFDFHLYYSYGITIINCYHCFYRIILTIIILVLLYCLSLRILLLYYYCSTTVLLSWSLVFVNICQSLGHH